MSSLKIHERGYKPVKAKNLKFASLLIFVLSAAVYSQLLYYSSLPKVNTPWPDFPYDSVLVKTWEGIKKRNIDAYAPVGSYNGGLVHRPKSERPGDAVSEGISYGMLLALYCNDQEYFDKVWDAGERYMWANRGGGGGGIF